MNYLTTQVALNGWPSFADQCLTPLRFLCGGKSYAIIEDERGDLSHAVSYGRVGLATQIAFHVIGFLATLITLPFVLIGLLVKHLSSHEREKYGYIQLCIEDKIPMIRFDKLSLRPKEIALSPDEFAKLETIDYTTLLTVWEEVGKDSPRRTEIHQTFAHWLKNQVPNPAMYDAHIPRGEVENAKAILERNLKVIALGCQDPEISPEVKQDALKRLYEAAIKCSPTWIEGSEEVTMLFKKADTPMEKLLRWVQQVKEEQILAFVQKPELGLGQWHGLSYARYMIGYECGLRYEQARYDGTIFYGGPSKGHCLGLFLQNFSPKLFIEALIEKIRRGNLVFVEEGKVRSNGVDQELNFLLLECADDYAKAAGVDITSDDYDQANYVISTFYDDLTKNYQIQNKCERVYQINEEGVKAILLYTELIGF